MCVCVRVCVRACVRACVCLHMFECCWQWWWWHCNCCCYFGGGDGSGGGVGMCGLKSSLYKFTQYSVSEKKRELNVLNALIDIEP